MKNSSLWRVAPDQKALQSFDTSRWLPGAEGAGSLQFCSNYCRCTLDMTVRDQLWDAPPDKLKSMSALCTAMSE